jgi:cation transport ATPase
VLYPVWGIVLNPVFAGLAMAMSSVSVISNSLRIKAKAL